MGSFECRDGWTDKILTLNGVRKYFGGNPLTYDPATNTYVPILANAGADIQFNPATKKWNAGIVQQLTLDYPVEADKLYAAIDRSLEKKNYLPFTLTAGVIGGALAGPVGAGCSLVAGTIADKLTNRLCNNKLKDDDDQPVGYTVNTYGGPQYDLDKTTKWDIFKTKIRNFNEWLNSTPISQPTHYQRTLNIIPTTDPRAYLLTYSTEAGGVPKRVIVDDANRIWRGFVKAQKPGKWKAKLCDFGSWLKTKVSDGLESCVS